MKTFVVDRMLGRLAKWLRILGYDAVYARHLDDAKALAFLRQGRTILTRPNRFRHLRDPGIVWIEFDHLPDQIRQLVRAGLIRTDKDACLSRCIRCNQPLVRIAKEAYRDRIPEYVYHTQTEFHRCPSCHRIYWPGTHPDRMHRYLRRHRIGDDPADPSAER